MYKILIFPCGCSIFSMAILSFFYLSIKMLALSRKAAYAEKKGNRGIENLTASPRFVYLKGPPHVSKWHAEIKFKSPE